MEVKKEKAGELMDKVTSRTIADPTLACLQCSKPAHFQCPKCLELKLPQANAAFCSQICFKAAWVSHKLSHVKVSDAEGEKNSSDICVADALSRGWRYCIRKGQARIAQLLFFDWTGPLRPYPISPRCIVPDKIARPDWASDGRPKEEPVSEWQNSVEIKSSEQIERMRETCKVTREVLDAAARVIRPGITTDEIDKAVHEATISAGGYPSPLNYHFFPKSCCTSVNEVICHGIPDARQNLTAGMA
ncbi:hypothetical protein O6H91_01G031500 [Diphasiastrum complanatum]|uniref:Uncharacterized protein n=1 Tax=Diphasiastrum complanatum TaxID=34168 RepID=A0ACC2EPQ6_DIPCM|nr:hypothetical protein O6H91_01G031500 [Diphasiastrum complanatum]